MFTEQRARSGVIYPTVSKIQDLKARIHTGDFEKLLNRLNNPSLVRDDLSSMANLTKAIRSAYMMDNTVESANFKDVVIKLAKASPEISGNVQLCQRAFNITSWTPPSSSKPPASSSSLKSNYDQRHGVPKLQKGTAARKPAIAPKPTFPQRGRSPGRTPSRSTSRSKSPKAFKRINKQFAYVDYPSKGREIFRPGMPPKHSTPGTSSSATPRTPATPSSTTNGFARGRGAGVNSVNINKNSATFNIAAGSRSKAAIK